MYDVRLISNACVGKVYSIILFMYQTTRLRDSWHIWFDNTKRAHLILFVFQTLCASILFNVLKKHFDVRFLLFYK